MALDFEGVLEVLKHNREQPTIEEEELASNKCPFCDWVLKVKDTGEKACPSCGRIWQ